MNVQSSSRDGCFSSIHRRSQSNTTIINKSAPMKETGNNSTTGHRLSCVVCRQTIPSAQTNDNRSSVSAFISIHQPMLYSRCDTCHGPSVPFNECNFRLYYCKNKLRIMRYNAVYQRCDMVMSTSLYIIHGGPSAAVLQLLTYSVLKRNSSGSSACSCSSQLPNSSRRASSSFSSSSRLTH